MADISQFTSKFRLGPATSLGSAGSASFAGDTKVAKRNRQPLSCQPCRARKLKCDRGHPCENCVKRSESDACQYGKRAATDAASASREPAARNNGLLNGALGGARNASTNGAVSGRAQDRLRQLEEMVRQMIDEKEGATSLRSDTNDQLQPRANEPTQPSSGVAPPDNTRPDPVQLEPEHEQKLTRSRHGTNYTGSTHWSAIFDQINGLRECLSQQMPNEEYTSNSPTSTASNESNMEVNPTTLFSAPQPLPLPDLLQQYLPSRRQVDRLLSTYFTSQYSTLLVLHTQQFARQYEAFQADPLHTSPIWISLLFSLLCTADMIQYTSSPQSESWRSSSQELSPATGSHTHSSVSSPGDPSSASPMRDHFLSAASQCLLLGNYTRPQPHLIEALAMFAQCKYALTIDPSRETTMIFALVVRLAYTMSYHRDADNYAAGQYTPFEGEMRRRVWHAIKMFDVMISFQLGIPRNIADNSADTKSPKYLLDTDFDEDCKQLPREREKTEPSAMLYFVTKIKLMEIFGQSVCYALSFRKATNQVEEDEEKADVMKLDAEIRKAVEDIPLVLKVKSMSMSFSDPSYLIMVRSNLMFLVNKSLCVLHRKFMMNSRSRDSKTTSYSRKVVLESSSKMVTHFLDLHSELQPGGQLHNDRWMLSSFKINDFSLAIMMLCFVFWGERRKAINSGRGKSEEQIDKEWLRSDLQARSTYDLLVQARDVGAEYGKRGIEAKRVSEILTAALKKVGSPDGIRGTDDARSQSSTSQVGQQDYSGHDSLNLSPLSINDQPQSTLSDPISSMLLPRVSRTIDDSNSRVQEHASGSWIVDSGVPLTKSLLDSAQDPLYTTNSQKPMNSVPMIYSDLEAQTLATWAPDANVPILESTDDTFNWARFDQFLGTYGSTPMVNTQQHGMPMDTNANAIENLIVMDVDATFDNADAIANTNSNADVDFNSDSLSKPGGGRFAPNHGLMSNWARW